MLYVDIPSGEQFILGESNQEWVLDNIHYKYNLIILPYKNNEPILIKGYGTDVKLVYPQILNFNLEDSINIKYIMILL